MCGSNVPLLSFFSLQPVLLGSSKAKSLLNDRKKPAKLMWTQAWRRLNKKLRDDNVAKKRLVF